MQLQPSKSVPHLQHQLGLSWQAQGRPELPRVALTKQFATVSSQQENKLHLQHPCTAWKQVCSGQASGKREPKGQHPRNSRFPQPLAKPQVHQPNAERITITDSHGETSDRQRRVAKLQSNTLALLGAILCPGRHTKQPREYPWYQRVESLSSALGVHWWRKRLLYEALGVAETGSRMLAVRIRSRGVSGHTCLRPDPPALGLILAHTAAPGRSPLHRQCTGREGAWYHPKAHSARPNNRGDRGMGLQKAFRQQSRR